MPKPVWDSRIKYLAFFRPDGTEMPAEDWQTPHVRSFAYLLGGENLVVPDQAGRRPVGNTLLMLLNAHHEAIDFTLPHVIWRPEWEVVVDTRLWSSKDLRYGGYGCAELESAETGWHIPGFSSVLLRPIPMI